VVDAVVKDHHGFIDLITKVGEGTSFYVYFPITRESMDSQDSSEICGGSETILVVDDDEIQREVSSQLLAKLGYEVNTIDSGEKALEFLKETPQDLVILDMVMPPGIDGAETYRQMLKTSPNQKAIILSGFSESDRVFEAQRLGAGAFVKKPVTRQIIAAAVRTELNKA
jgi:two-component system cell cycle sensor histidine kinase/response regulator CckA